MMGAARVAEVLGGVLHDICGCRAICFAAWGGGLSGYFALLHKRVRPLQVDMSWVLPAAGMMTHGLRGGGEGGESTCG